ncbi:hypothetical protein PPUN110474_06780 [Pseudomonas putida]|nr:hypothetical protein PPUN110474_06780 [Pseudomonas putida]
MSRKGRKAAPGFKVTAEIARGCCAAHRIATQGRSCKDQDWNSGSRAAVPYLICIS